LESIEFNKLLNEAINEDLTAVERTGCVKYGFDLNDAPIVTFLPKLGFNTVPNEKEKDIGKLCIHSFINSLTHLLTSLLSITQNAIITIKNHQ